MTFLDTKLTEDGCDPELLLVIKSLVTGCKKISNILSSGDFSHVAKSDEVNVQGEIQTTLDIVSNDILKEVLSKLTVVKSIASEEDEHILSVNENGKYLVSFDPLDGSSNIDINGLVGTIFSVTSSTEWLFSFDDKQFQRPGGLIHAAGFVLYGPATTLVLSTGVGTNIFVLSREFGEFTLWRKSIAIPPDTNEFSANVGRQRRWPGYAKKYVDQLSQGRNGVRRKDYSFRYFGSLVGDIYRILCRGGVFLYPQEGARKSRYGNGKLRLLYEIIPMAYIVEQANGAAYADDKRVLDILPTSVHQRVPIIIGSRNEVDRYLSKAKVGLRNAE
ncbi:class 1 fructose-bisphosphatase [Alteromonas sp. ZYF713]|nr:class 1 fructose-bisphosphatase [Alteromonas sp. ZYF713]